MNTAHQHITYDSLRDALKLKNFQLRQNLIKKHEHISSDLLNKSFNINALRQKSGHLISAGALAGAFLLAPTIDAKPLPTATETIDNAKTSQANAIPVVAPQKVLIDSLAQILPEKTRPLTHEEEKKIRADF